MKQEGGSVFREGAPYQRRGSLQLWQFLVALLDDPGNAHFIAWTGRGMEFKLIEPEEVSPPPHNATHGSRTLQKTAFPKSRRPRRRPLRSAFPSVPHSLFNRCRADNGRPSAIVPPTPTPTHRAASLLSGRALRRHRGFHYLSYCT